VYVEVANEAAFYGPKIDVQVWSAIGREFTPDQPVPIRKSALHR
jgi:threonyl-tRNA synthetase